MSTCLLVIDDGREDYLDRCLASAAEFLSPMDACVMVNDSDHQLGFAGAVKAGWEGALETGCKWVFGLESDFVFLRPVPIAAMAQTLVEHERLVQVALLRQPWNSDERAAGGIVAQTPDLYTLHEEGDRAWLEHRRCVTTNPALWPRWVIERGWPLIDQSEGHFGFDLFRDPARRAAYWGRGEEWVEHIGHVRAGKGY